MSHKHNDEWIDWAEETLEESRILLNRFASENEYLMEQLEIAQAGQCVACKEEK